MKITVTKKEAEYLLFAINVCIEELNQPPGKDEAGIIIPLMRIINE
jgi:hypothetical protein